MTILLSTLTLGTGRSNILFGMVHVLVFAVFIFLVFAP
jgi:Ca2+:H+ antiporter